MTAPAQDLPSDRSPRLQQVTQGSFAYLQPDGGWMVNNTGAVVAAAPSCWSIPPPPSAATARCWPRWPA